MAQAQKHQTMVQDQVTKGDIGEGHHQKRELPRI